MIKKIFLLLLLTSFATIFGQNADLIITDANGAPVTCPENGLTLTDAATSIEVEGPFTITDGRVFVYGMTVGETYNYSALPPACFTNQTPSTGSFVLPPRGEDGSRPKIILNSFLGAETNTVLLTVTTDGVATNVEGQMAKLVHVSGPGVFVEFTGTNNNDGTWTFNDVPFGNWNVVVDNPCLETKRSGYNSSDGPVIIACPVTDPISYTFNVNTTEEPQGEIRLGTGEGYQIPITDCNANYPIQISGGNQIVDNTEYSISYTVDAVNYVAVATSYPTFNSPPANVNNHNRIDFIPQGTVGSDCTVTSITPTVGTCPAIVVTADPIQIQGAPLANISVAVTGGDPWGASPIISGTLTNIDTNEVINGVDNWGFSFSGVPQGTYYATFQLTDCKEDEVINDIVVDCAGISSGITISFDINDVPSVPSSDLVYFVLSNGDPINGGLVAGAEISLTSDACEYFNASLTTDPLNATNFTGVPLGMVNYTITKDCYPTVTGSFEVTAEEYDFSTVYLPIPTNDMVYFTLSDGNPINGGLVSGAVITLTNSVCSSFEESLTTDGLNATNFTGVPEGTVNYTITKDCYPTLTGSFELSADEYNFSEVYTLANINDNVFFNLTDGNSMLVSGATITLTSSICSSYVDVSMESDGVNPVNFTGVPEGLIYYTITKQCYPTVEGSFELTDTEYTYDEDYQPNTTNILTIFVNKDDVPFSGVQIRVYNDDFSYDQTNWGVQNGVADFFNVPYGDVTYEITGGDCVSPANGMVTIDCNSGDTISTTVALENGTAGDLYMTVTDGSSNIDGAEIHVFNTTAGYDETKVSDQWDTNFKDVPYGELSYEVTKEGKTTATGTIMIECQQYNITYATVTLEPALGIAKNNSNTLQVYSYPNPFTNDFGINIVSISQDKIQYKVYDMIGRLVEQNSIEVSNLQNAKIGNNFEAGIYNVILTQGDFIKTLRVIKK